MVVMVLAGASSPACKRSASAPESAQDKAQPAEAANAPSGDGIERPELELGVIPQGPVAVVNGHEISRDSFMAMYKLRLAMHESTGKPLTAALDRRYRQNIMSRLVYGELLRQESLRTGHDFEPAVLEQRFAELKAGVGDWQASLARTGESDASRKQMLADQLREHAILAGAGALEITDQAVRDLYEVRKPRYHDSQPRLAASNIIVTIDPRKPGDPDQRKPSAAQLRRWERDARKRANQLYRLAREEGRDFRALARARSEGWNAPSGGDMEIFNASQIDARVAKVIFDMKPGQISKPIRSVQGFEIVKVTAEYPPGYLPISAVRRSLEGKVMKSLLGAARAEIRQRLHENANIQWRLLPKPESKLLPRAKIARVEKKPIPAASKK